MNPSLINNIAAEVRGLILDASFHSKSGHMGVPLACADILAYLYGHFLKFSLGHVPWQGRDRFILSSGHAALAQYACLHMAGFPLTLDDLKNHRQIYSAACSHPQYNLSLGMEASTGADGQGVGYAVGHALALKRMAAKLPSDDRDLFDSKVIVLAGDGCLMEGISYEACSLAGLWKLDNLILVYNSDGVSLDGKANLTLSEDITSRFTACHWVVLDMNGHDPVEMDEIFSKLRKNQKKPVLLIARTEFGRGLLRAASLRDHKNTLSANELGETRSSLGLSDTPFYVSQETYAHFSGKAILREQLYQDWSVRFAILQQRDPVLLHFFSCLKIIPDKISIPDILREPSFLISGREMGHQMLNAFSTAIPTLLACSADTSLSDGTFIVDSNEQSVFTDRNIRFGVREFAMGCIAIGLAQVGFIPVLGCYLAFSDYMRNAIRSAAMMGLKVIFHFTHDSIFVGQDGPTHQPVEHLVSLRAMPELHVVRPANPLETQVHWEMALNRNGPTAFVLSRQKYSLENLNVSAQDKKSIAKGGYIHKESLKNTDIILVSTGSELSRTMQVSLLLEKTGKKTKVISIPCWDILLKGSASYREKLFLPTDSPLVIIEAAAMDPWNHLNPRAHYVSVNDFGYSATVPQLERQFCFTAEDIVKQILERAF